MPATYNFDITNDAGKVRALCTDVGPDWTFSDDEILAFISLAPANLFTAAALACETWARTRAHQSKALTLPDGTRATRFNMKELLELAASLRASALTDSGLVTDTWGTSTPGELLDSFRPEWRGINDLPVVE